MTTTQHKHNKCKNILTLYWIAYLCICVLYLLSPSEASVFLGGNREPNLLSTFARRGSRMWVAGFEDETYSVFPQVRCVALASCVTTLRIC